MIAIDSRDPERQLRPRCELHGAVLPPGLVCPICREASRNCVHASHISENKRIQAFRRQVLQDELITSAGALAAGKRR